MTYGLTNVQITTTARIILSKQCARCDFSRSFLRSHIRFSRGQCPMCGCVCGRSSPCGQLAFPRASTAPCSAPRALASLSGPVLAVRSPAEMRFPSQEPRFVTCGCSRPGRGLEDSPYSFTSSAAGAQHRAG